MKLKTEVFSGPRVDTPGAATRCVLITGKPAFVCNPTRYDDNAGCSEADDYFLWLVSHSSRGLEAGLKEGGGGLEAGLKEGVGGGLEAGLKEQGCLKKSKVEKCHIIVWRF